jgi:hypothetical protein
VAARWEQAALAGAHSGAGGRAHGEEQGACSEADETAAAAARGAALEPLVLGALRCYDLARTHDGRGLTISSQVRLEDRLRLDSMTQAFLCMIQSLLGLGTPCYGVARKNVFTEVRQRPKKVIRPVKIRSARI